MNLKKVAVHIYVSELIDNEDGKFDSMGSAWLVVPEYWAEEQVKRQGYGGLNEFFNEYTYDDTEGWLHKATTEGVLLGCGIGEASDDTIWRLTEEDFECCLSDMGIDLSDVEKQKLFDKARSSFNIEEWSEWVY